MAERSKAEKNKIFARICKNFTTTSEATYEVRAAALDDAKFAAGEQWDQATLKERKGRPCLTIDKLDGSIKQICNEHRQNRAAIKYRPFEGGDVKKAELVNGIVRHIMNNGNANYAINMAFDQAVRSSFGFFRVITDYVSPDSFDQEIYVKTIKNPLSVYFPLHLINEPDYSDTPYVHIRSTMAKTEYERLYPKDKITSWSKSGIGDNVEWENDDSVFIIEYFEKSTVEKTIYLVTDGVSKITIDNLEPVQAQIDNGELRVLDERKTTENKVNWYKCSGGGILDEREWAGKYIPVIPLLGQEVNIEGKIILFSATRKAKDPQRMLNYWKSLETEMIALQPKVPYIGAAGQFEGHEEWATANQKNYPYLEYEPVSSAGQLAPPPQRVGTIGIDAGVVNAIRESADDIKSTTGIFDASLGARGNETSGVAINQRKRQGQTANYHFTDSSILALQYLGKILLDLIPKIYDTQRIIRIVGEDGLDTTVEIPDGYFDNMERFDIVVDTGPDFSTKRTEIVENLSMLSQANPMFAELTGDIVAQNLDIEGAQALSDRVKRFIEMKYPGLIESDGQGISEAEVKQIVADLQALQQQLQMKDQQAQQMAAIIRDLQRQVQDKTADRVVKIETAQIKAAADIDKARIMAQPVEVANTQKTIEHLHKADLEKARLVLDALIAKNDADFQDAQLALNKTAPVRNAEESSKE